MPINNNTYIKSNSVKTVGTPRAEYLSVQYEWQKNRAVIQGQSYTKDYDVIPNINRNILLPFNRTMTQQQYEHYKAEAELPGISSQYAKMLSGGLLRKNPLLEINSTDFNLTEARDWILNRFGQANESLVSFLDSALWEELQTSRAWVQIDYPNVDLNSLSPEQRSNVCPYPILHKAENIINWRTRTDQITGESKLSLVITRFFRDYPSDINPYHTDTIDTVQVHYLDAEGYYAIDTFVNRTSSATGPAYIDGSAYQSYNDMSVDDWTLINSNTNILLGGQRMDFIPFVPLNGSIEIMDAVFTPIVDREIALYNKISRRNHLLYLAATYTPIVRSDNLTEQQKDQLANQGLGTWMFVGKEDQVETLATPTTALADMDRAILDGYNELTRIGVKMLSLEPNNSDSSGIALQIRNASQNAQIATLNAKVSESMKKVIQIMLYWKYNSNITLSDIRFNLSSDFNRIASNSETTRIISEWYQGGIIPRSVFVEIMKNNDILPSDYSDDDAMNEIESDPLVMSPRQSAQNEVNAIVENNNNLTRSNNSNNEDLNNTDDSSSDNSANDDISN